MALEWPRTALDLTLGKDHRLIRSLASYNLTTRKITLEKFDTLNEENSRTALQKGELNCLTQQALVEFVGTARFFDVDTQQRASHVYNAQSTSIKRGSAAPTWRFLY